MKPTTRRFFTSSLFPVAIVLTCGGTSKADNTWDGGGSTPFNWSDATNWGSDTAPTYGTLTFTGSTGTTNTVDASISQNMLLWTGTSAWTLNNSGGAIISLYDNSGSQAKIENQSTGLVTINAPIDFAASTGTNRGEINAINGDITFDSSGTITASGSAVSELHFYGSGHTVTVNSVITAGSRKLIIGPNAADNNTVILNAANSYSGNTEVNVGTLQVGNSTGLGTSSVYLGNGGSTYANLNASLLLNASGLTVANAITTNKADTGAGLGSGTRTIGGTYTSGTSTFSGTLSLNGGAILTSGNGGTLAYTGNIVDGTDTGNVSRNLSITGTGATVVLSGTNTYTGKTAITGGATLSISADAKLGTAPGTAVADQLTLNGGTLKITAAAQTLAANRGITLGASGGTLDTSSISGTGITTTVGGIIAGSGPLTLKSTGNLTATGGGDAGLGIKLNQAANTFTGDVTITSGLVTYAANGSFGNSANKIILNGGGLLDNNTNIALSRTIDVQAGGGTFRTWGSTNVIWSGAITGSGTINRTDGGTITHSGDLSGFTGTYNIQGGTTQLTGTAASIGGNWSIATGTTLNINSTVAQTLNGNISGAGTMTVTSTPALSLGGTVNLSTGSLNINTAGIVTLTSGSSLNVDNINLTGTTSNQLNIQAGATVTTKYFNIGNSTNNSGRVVQTGGTVTVASGGNGMRIGHWNNGSNAGSLYNLSGGTLDASAITTNVGWDGQGDMIVGGGAGAALFKSGGISLDSAGNGGGSGAGDMTLTISANGTVEVGTSGISGAAAGDRVILNSGTMKAVGNSTWGSVINANSATTSTLDANGFNATLTNNLTGTGTINLSSATGSVIFNTTGTQTIDPLLSGSTSITKSGTGTTSLTGVGSTHSGTITISDGRLNLGGTTTSGIILAATKTLGGEGTTTGDATLNGGFLNIDPTTAGKLTVNNLSLTGTNSVRFDTAPTPAGGPINVLTYTGALTGTLGTNLVLENAAKYRNSTFVDTAGAVTIDLLSKNLTWNGTSGGQWDTLTSSRWNTAEVDQFAWGDSVTFDDNGVTTAVVLSGELQPSAISISGTKNYTFTGGVSNFISGNGGITKSGSTIAILNAPNTFTGANSISGGTLQIGDGTNNTATLGTGATSIASGTNLIFYRNGTSSISNAISGAGTLALQGTGTSGQSDYSITGNNSSFSGTFEVRNGARANLDSTADVGTSAINVNSGGQIFLGNATTYTNAVSINGIGWTESAGNLGAVRFAGGATLSGAVTLTGNSRLTAYASADTGTISGIISDGASSFGLTKTGAGTLTLTNANTYDGGTTISAGTLNIRNAASLGTGNVVLGDSSTGTSNTALYIDTNRTIFAKQVTISSSGTGTATLGSLASVTTSGDNNQFTNIVLQRNVTFDSNASDRTDYKNITGNGNITVSGVGRTIFSTANSYVGNLTIRTSTDANGLQLGAASSPFNALYDSGSVQIDSGGKLTLSYTASGSETIGALNGAGTVRQNGGALNTLIMGNGNGSGTFSGVITNGGGTIAITKVGSGTQTLSGANTQTGATAINGGTLALDYATQNNTKLSDSAALTFGAGTSTLSLNGGSHTEVVASTTLAAGAAANITRPSGTSVVQLGTITVGANATLNLSAPSIATTNNTNTNGMLGAWATIGTDWAMNSTNAPNGPITAYTGYTDYTRLSSGTKIIANTAASNARIIEGTSTLGDLTLAAATTNINTLNQTATGGLTIIDMSTNTLRLGTAGGILAGSGVAALNIGKSVNQGFLSAGGSTTNTAGTLYLTNNSANTVTINSPVINNGTGAVTLVKSGTGIVTLAGYTGANYSGGTIVDQGELRVVAPTTAATYATLGTGAVTVNTDATLRFFTGSTSASITYANAINLNNATLADEDGALILTGNVALTGTNTVNGRWADKNITMSGVISGAGSLVKTNTSGQNNVLTLSGNNTYTGTTTITLGTIKLGHINALGTTAAGTTVASGGTLDLNGLAIGAEAINLSGTGVNAAGALINSNTTTAASLSGAITLAAASSAGGAGNTTLSGVISGAGMALTKVGAGTLTLSGNNTYTGTTTVSAGRLNLTGSNASNITVSTGGTLGSSGSTTGSVTTAAGTTIALNGLAPATGLSTAGAVSFAASTALIFDATPTALGTTQHLVTSYGTLSGLANLTAPTGYRSTIIDDTANKKVFLTISTGNRTWNMTSPGTWNILTNTSWVENDTLFAQGDAVLFDDTATNGAVTLTGALSPSSVTFNNSSTAYSFTGAGSIAGSTTVTKGGTSTATIATNNTYTGSTIINTGVINIQHANALGASTAGTTVASGAALEIQGGITSPEPLSLSGTGVSSGGALRNISGNNSITGAITFAAPTRINSDAGTLTLTSALALGTSNNLTVGGAGNTTLSGTVSSTGATLTKEGAGSLTMSGSGDSVNILVNNGTLYARGGGFSTAFDAGKTITVDGTGILDTITHSMGSSVGGGGDVPIVVLTNGGTWRANNEQYIRSVTMTAGNVIGNGELRTLSGSVYTSNAAATSSTISAGLNLTNAVSIVVNNGAAADDLVIGGYIAGSGGAITKSGAGTAVINGAATNSFTTALTINAGAVRIEKGSALGTTAAGTTVASGAALQLSNNITVGAEALSLSGTGESSDGALRNISGNNTYGGAITLAAATRINSDANLMTLSGGITGAAQNLTVGGAGNTTISGAIATTTGTLTKDGGGILTLTGTNTYSGDTSVNAGTLRVSGTNSGSGLVSVASGATLGGGGSIAGAVNVSGVLAPGSSIESLATGSLTMATGSSLAYEMQDTTGTGADLVDVTGDFSLNGIVDLALTKIGTATWSVNDKLTLLSYTGTWNSGLFSYGGSSVADDTNLTFDGQLWTLDYNDTVAGSNYSGEVSGSYVTLTAIPEPDAAMLVGGFGVLALLRRRRVTCATR